MSNDDTLQAAYVLHRRLYANSSLLLELLTADSGRLACIARGARRPRSRMVGLLQPFVPLFVALRGRGEVQTLATAEAAGSAPQLAGERLYCGLYLNELLMALTHRRDPHPGLFAIYGAALAALAAEADLDHTLRRFEVDMFRELGYGLPLTHERDSHRPVEPARHYRYVPAEGPVPAAAGPATIGGDTLLALDAGRPLTGAAQLEARNLMRAIVSHYLEGRKIRSRELFGRDDGNV